MLFNFSRFIVMVFPPFAVHANRPVRADGTLFQLGKFGRRPLARKKSMTNSSNPAGSSMQHAWPVLGRILCTAPGISEAVRRPLFKELSYSPLITKVGTFIDSSRGVMSV